jgi:hypothetical protein
VRQRRLAYAESGRRYDIGRHLLRIEQVRDGWVASVDGLALGGFFGSEVAAWAAGVQAAHRLDLGEPRAPSQDG